MRWPWRRHRDDAGAREAARARRAAEDRLRQTREKGEEVSRVAARLRQIRRRNEFAAMIESAFGGQR